MVLKSEASYVV